MLRKWLVMQQQKPQQQKHYEFERQFERQKIGLVVYELSVTSITGSFR